MFEEIYALVAIDTQGAARQFKSIVYSGVIEMELEVMELTAEEVKLVECYRAMTPSDKSVCLFLATRFIGKPTSASSLSSVNCNGKVIFHVGDNSSNNLMTNIQTPK